MLLVFTSYVKSPEFDDPGKWLKRIEGYIGILENLGQQHTVISVERINYEGQYSANGVIYFFQRQRKKVVLFPRKAHRLIKGLKPDVVFVNGLIFPLQTIQLRLKLGKDVKIICLHHAEKPFTGIKKYLQWLADKCIDAYCFTSAEFGDEWIQNGNLADKRKIHEVMEVSSSFYPADRYISKVQTKMSGSPTYLWVGRLNDNKDPVTVVSAFLRLSKVVPGVKLYMIFQTDELLARIKDIISKSTGGDKAIILVGHIPHSELLFWYSGADFILSGSHYEGSGTAVCEAMSCGCVPILTDIPSFRMMTGRGKCGLLYEAGSIPALTDVLKQSMMTDLVKEREKTLTQFTKELSYEAIGRKINAVISSLIK